MSDKTTYVVETEYKVKDDASTGLHKIGEEADHASEHVEGLRDVLKEVGETFLLFEGAEKAKEAFIGFNAEVQTAKTQLQAVLGVNFKQSWETAGNAAEDFYDRFEGFAEEFPVSATEMAGNVRELSVAVAEAGGNMEDLLTITERGAIAQRVFGLETRQLMMALEGHVSARTPGGMALLNAVGMSPEQWRKLTKESRLALTKQALESDVITKGGQEFAQSFAGQAAILKDRLEVAAGKVGLPLFQALNRELKGWNEWLTRNSERVSEISAKIASGLVTGFGYLKDVASFLYDHSGVLIKIAEAWALVKIGGFASQLVGGVFGKLDKLGGLLSVGGLAGRIGAAEGIGGKLAAGTGALGIAAAIAVPAGQILGEQLGDAVYPGVRRLKEMEESVAKMDERFREAAEAASHLKDALGTSAAARLSANLGESRERERAIREALTVDTSTMLGRTAGKIQREQILKNAGFDPTEIEALGVGGNYGLASALGTTRFAGNARQDRLNLATRATDVGLKEALSHMSADQRAHLNVAKATNLIMEKQLSLLASGKMPLNEEGIKKFLLENKELQSEQAKINQTVNVTIQQVSAKDPDRWIADMDAYAANKVRARTKARGALARGH